MTAPFPGPALAGFRVFRMYIVYLDEFGHVGPFISRSHPKHKASPVFGLGGIVVPIDRARSLSTFFYKLKCNFLDFEIKRSGKSAFEWEKKGSALYTTRNDGYPELHRTTHRLFSQLEKSKGYLFYTGMKKERPKKKHTAVALYQSVWIDALKRLNSFAGRNNSRIVICVDEQGGKRQKTFRNNLIQSAAVTMFADKCWNIVEIPFQVESDRYQMMQWADWMCGLLGRWYSWRVDPIEYSEFVWADRRYGRRIKKLRTFSSFRAW